MHQWFMRPQDSLWLESVALWVVHFAYFRTLRKYNVVVCKCGLPEAALIHILLMGA